MISYNYKKYKNISDFIFDKPNGADKPFSILQKCGGVSGNEYNDKCFGCFFCAFNDKDRMTKLLNRFDQDFLEKVIQESFGGTPIKFPPFKGSSEYSSIEKFTTVNEKQHIQPWVTGLVHNMCTKRNRISMEIPIPHPDYRRVGRLDVGCITSDHMLALETKTNVADALNDERFVEQHIKYTEVIDSITKDYTYLTFIGGKETDLYPESSSFCTGMSGNSAERFLKLLDLYFCNQIIYQRN